MRNQPQETREMASGQWHAGVHQEQASVQDGQKAAGTLEQASAKNAYRELSTLELADKLRSMAQVLGAYPRHFLYIAADRLSDYWYKETQKPPSTSLTLLIAAEAEICRLTGIVNDRITRIQVLTEGREVLLTRIDAQGAHITRLERAVGGAKEALRV